MLDSLRLYFHYISISIRSQMQYRASFIMMTIGGFLISGIEFVAIWALFDRFKNINGWTLPEAALLYGMVDVVFAITEAYTRGFDQFSLLVKSGDFDRVMLRPRSTILQLLGHELQLMRLGRLLQGLVVLLWSISVLDIVWTPARILLLLASIFGGICVFSGIFVLQAVSVFWTVEKLDVWNSVTNGGVQAAQYPLSIYNPWLRGFFTYIIPLGCISYIPALAIIGRTNNLTNWLAPAIGFGFYFLTLQLWKIGVRHYNSTGS